jgi:hypothetical protein
MRVLNVLVASLFLGGVVTAQAPAAAAKAPQPAQAASAAKAPQPAAAPRPAQAAATFKAKPVGNLAQVMQGILFPNSNIIFKAQEVDPGAPPPAAKPGERADFGGLYQGWQGVENSAVALIESAALITMPGRLCSNGKPAPVQRANWPKFAQGLVDAGMATLKAAKAKDQDAIVDAAGVLTDACAACHEVYRDKPGGVAARCQ